MNPLDNLTFAKHGCLRFAPKGGPVVYVDPFQLTGNPLDADVIIVTHPHSDHFSPRDIRRIMKSDTEFISTRPVLDELCGEMGRPAARTHLLGTDCPPVEVKGIRVTALPAENKNHPLGFGFGLLLELGGFVYSIAGDTDILADAACDVMFVPCDGIYNMPDYEHTVPAQLDAMQHRPPLVVPYHYAGYIEGTDENGQKLCNALTAAGYSSALVIKA